MDQDQVMRQARDENFPVALRVLPAATRQHLLAIYGFARMVDDVGDELDGDRLAALDRVAEQVDLAFGGRATDPIVARLTPTIEACGLEPEPFHRLIEANRLDQTTSSYATWDDLAHYCTLSADPVGRLVLAVFGVATPERIALSDAVCTGLQLVEHLQDVREDLERGRIYLPTEDMVRFGVEREDLAARVASHRVRWLVAFEVRRARDLLAAGGPLVGSLDGWARLAVAGFVAGGRAALDAIEAADHDVLAGLRTPGKVRLAAHGAHLLGQRRRTAA